MVNKQIYISCPITVDEDVLDEFVELVDGIEGLTSYHWERGTIYSQRMFDTSDAYLFILPNNRFEANNTQLPIGLKKELEAAYKTGKKIFVGYQTKSGEKAIYSATTNGFHIGGIAGTTHEISSLVDSDVVTTKYDPITFGEIKGDTNYSFDERALLMLL
jgi:hypothetical protein